MKWWVGDSPLPRTGGAPKRSATKYPVHRVDLSISSEVFVKQGVGITIITIMKNKLCWLVIALAVSVAWNATGKDEKIQNWPAYSGDKASTKYSPLDQINKDTVGKLAIAWRQSGVPAELKAIWPDASAPANWQNTPIMVDGLL